jgi:hypothetical protein
MYYYGSPSNIQYSIWNKDKESSNISKMWTMMYSQGPIGNKWSSRRPFVPHMFIKHKISSYLLSNCMCESELLLNENHISCDFFPTSWIFLWRQACSHSLTEYVYRIILKKSNNHSCQSIITIFFAKKMSHDSPDLEIMIL